MEENYAIDVDIYGTENENVSSQIPTTEGNQPHTDDSQIMKDEINGWRHF